jgi:hypothetical protein
MIVGVDFGGPASAAAQRRKIIAIAAGRAGRRRYVVQPAELNRRLLSNSAPGWTAGELAAELSSRREVETVAADFPFSVPDALLGSESFAALVGRPKAFQTWRAFSSFVAERVPLAPPLDLAAFAPWRAARLRAIHWSKRGTDVAAGAQPPLKDRYQCLFNMTLLGVSLLRALRAQGYAIVPFDRPTERRAIEVYPGGAMRALGCPDYKRRPAAAIEAMLAHCAAAGVEVEVDRRVRRLCERYDTGRASPDPDASDALIALCLGILHREGLTRELIPRSEESRRNSEGVIWGLTPREPTRRAA